MDAQKFINISIVHISSEELTFSKERSGLCSCFWEVTSKSLEVPKW